MSQLSLRVIVRFSWKNTKHSPNPVQWARWVLRWWISAPEIQDKGNKGEMNITPKVTKSDFQDKGNIGRDEYYTQSDPKWLQQSSIKSLVSALFDISIDLQTLDFLDKVMFQWLSSVHTRDSNSDTIRNSFSLYVQSVFCQVSFCSPTSITQSILIPSKVFVWH